MNIFSAPPAAAIKHLLAENKLPFDDIDELDLSCFLGYGSAEAPCGVIGLEIHQQHALLRSLVVSQTSRHSGCGKKLVSAIEQLAREKGVHNLYLLTETANRFFARRGYDDIDRNHLPDTIKQTAQFSQLCPQSAIAMTKRLHTVATTGSVS
jgi:amino-acid N-acetyltransferase